MRAEYRGTTTVLQHGDEATVEEVMDALREDEETRRSYNDYSAADKVSSDMVETPQAEQAALSTQGTHLPTLKRQAYGYPT